MNSSVRSILSLSWQSAAYGIGVVGSQIIVYLMLPVLTHSMPREDYGAVSVIVALYAFVNTLTNAGLPSATFRFYNETENADNSRLILGASQLLFFLFAAIPAAGIMLGSKPLSLLLLGTDRYALAIQLAALFLVVDTMNLFGTIILRIHVRPLAASIQGMVLVACETGLAVFFVVVRHMGVVGYWLGFFVGAIVGLAFTAWLVRKAIVFQVSWTKAWELMKFGIPLIPSAISMTALHLADRYILGAMAGLEQVAIYDVGYKLGSIASMVIAPFRIAWVPFAFSIAKKPEAPKVYRDVFTYLAATCSFLTLGVFAFRGALLHLIAPAAYSGAAVVVGWVAASQLFLALYLVLLIGPMIAKRTQDLAWSAVLAGILNLVLNIVLIPSMGILGAAIATFIGYLALAILTYLAGQRSFAFRIDWNRLIKLSLTSAAIAGMIVVIERLSRSAPLEITLKILVLMLFPVALFLTGFLSRLQGKTLWDAGMLMMKRKSVTNRD